MWCYGCDEEDRILISRAVGGQLVVDSFDLLVVLDRTVVNLDNDHLLTEASLSEEATLFELLDLYTATYTILIKFLCREVLEGDAELVNTLLLDDLGVAHAVLEGGGEVLVVALTVDGYLDLIA